MQEENKNQETSLSLNTNQDVDNLTKRRKQNVTFSGFFVFNILIVMTFALIISAGGILSAGLGSLFLYPIYIFYIGIVFGIPVIIGAAAVALLKQNLRAYAYGACIAGIITMIVIPLANTNASSGEIALGSFVSTVYTSPLLGSLFSIFQWLFKTIKQSD